MKRLTAFFLITLLSLSASAQNRSQDQTLSQKIAGLQKIEGFIPFYWDAATGKMWMEISRFNAEIIYQVSLATGVGSNPVGLDRGQLGDTRIVYFERIGPKVLMIEPNYDYRALSNDAAERRAVEESFARSVIWGFKVEALEGDRVLVDATAFFMRDAHGVADRLRQARQGQFRFDENRSAFYLPRTKGFPKNTEIETILTFASDEPGPLVRSVTPTAQAVTVRQHHSFVELPDNNYKPRKFDPRVGMNSRMFYDYASPITEPIEKRWIARHRLQKKDPDATISEPVKPIIYYVDNGAPEPIRSALVEGAAWWNQAFEAAGFKNAFQVRVLPADADPMDVRYNVINWVHRSTRGWSYGASITDPRTGEIIKGHVTLGSLRVRQDYMIGTGMIPSYDNGSAGADGCELGMIPEMEYLAVADPATDSEAMSIARIRQLSAHEVGHTIGLAHNFAASSYGRASVMDYPAPMVEIKNNKLDLSNAYGVGIGEYDKFAIKYGYAEFSRGANEDAELEKILGEGTAAGMLFISDSDARPPGAAHPLASLWDNGGDPVEMLRHEMRVRKIAMGDFGLRNIPNLTPMSLLEAKFLPLYLHHRYQLQAAVKSVGGLYYTYAVKTARGPNPSEVRKIVPAAQQRKALQAVIETIKVEELAIPLKILDLIPPRAFGYFGGTTELFSRRTDPAFDPIGAATIAAEMSISGLLEPNRAARLIEFHSYDAANPDFKEVVDALINATWKTPAADNTYHQAIQRAIQSLLVSELMDLAANDSAVPEVRAVANQGLRALSVSIKAGGAGNPGNAHRNATMEEIERFLARPDAPRKRTAPLATPAGDPIGAGRSGQ